MQQLIPEPIAETTAYDAYRSTAEQVCRLNFVQSVDGRATDAEGLSGGLGGPGDLEVFTALRALADAILVGAGTARAEGYGPHRLRPSLAIRRRRDGRMGPAPIVLVTRSAAIDPGARVFTEARTRTIVLTCTAAPASRRAALAEVADLILAGEDDVDLSAGLAALRARGLSHVLCEGGPSLAGDLLAGGLVDEVCTTIAPRLVGGDGPGMVTGLGAPLDLELVRLLTDGSELFATYRPVAEGAASHGHEAAPGA